MAVKGIYRPYINGPLFTFDSVYLFTSQALYLGSKMRQLSPSPSKTTLPYLSSIPCFSHATFSLCTLTAAAAAKSLQSCPTLCEPIDSSPPGSSVHRIL